MKYLISILAGIIIAISIFFAFNKDKEVSVIPQGYGSIEEYVLEQTKNAIQESQNELGAVVQPAGLFTYRLSGSGISSSATSFTLTKLTLPQNTYPIQDSDLSDTFYMTLEPGSVTKQEFVSCATVGANTGGTVSISGCVRGLSPITPYTASTTLQFTHSGGSAAIFSDAPGLFNQYPAKANTEHITGSWGFQGTAPTSTICAASNELCSKTYVDNLIAQGVATSTEENGGQSELATETEVASSTATTANKPLVIQAQNATSTPAYSCDSTGTIGALCIAVARNSGKLHQLWLDLTEAFTWTGAHIFNSTATFNATTTIAASSVTNNALVLNGVVLGFPSAQGAASTTLINNGAGNLSWLGFNKKLTTLPNTSQNCSTNNAASTTIYSIVVPANTLNTTNGIKVKTNLISGNYAGGNLVWFDVGYGTASTTGAITVNADGGFGGGGAIEVILLANGATNSQIINLLVDNTGAGAGMATAASFSQDSTTEKLLTLVSRSISNGPLTCGSTVAEIIQ